MLQAIAVFISQPKIAKHLTKLELLAALTAAVAYLMLIVLIILIFNYVGILTDCDFSTQVCHDLDHPGVNEKYLVSTGSHLAGTKQKMVVKPWKLHYIVAVLYDNRSVLENHHWRSAIACFIESGLARYLLNLPTSHIPQLYL